jgi:hypothetical protein
VYQGALRAGPLDAPLTAVAGELVSFGADVAHTSAAVGSDEVPGAAHPDPAGLVTGPIQTCRALAPRPFSERLNRWFAVAST